MTITAANIIVEPGYLHIDFDYQTTWAYNDRHQLVWGAGYRYVFVNLLVLHPFHWWIMKIAHRCSTRLFRIQLRLIPNELDLTVGSKFEHNDYTGFEFQPNARIAWYPTNDQTIWASVSRAVRTPSRAEDDGRLNIQYVPAFGVIAQQQGNESIESETLAAYELGYRIRPTRAPFRPRCVYFNEYDDLRTFEFGAPANTGSGAFLPLVAQNLGEGRTYGFELAATADVTPDLSLKASYTYTNLDLKNKLGSSDITLEQEEGKIPKTSLTFVQPMMLQTILPL